MQIKSKFRSFCGLCHHTVWAGEVVNYYPGNSPRTGYVTHLDCENALRDKSPRRPNSEVRARDNLFLGRMNLQNKILARKP